MRSRTLRGFTLIELIVVIGIIILATGFIAPSLAKFFQNRALNNAGTLITTILNGARNEAVTTKKPVDVVFLKRGLRVYKWGEKAWDGGLEPYDTAGPGNLSYRLEFVRGASYEDYRHSVIDESAGTTSASGEDASATDGDLYLRFRPDGTIDFGRFRDVSSHEFEQDPPARADIIIDQKSDDLNKGFIDIRATGRVVFKIATLEE